MKEKSDRKTTSQMLNELKKEDDINEYISRNEDNFLCVSISKYLDNMLRKYCVNKNEAIAKADIDRSYGYQILNGRKYASRDKYIRLCIGIGMNLEDVQSFLTFACLGSLYVKVKRDALIIFCINHKFDIKKTQSLLFENDVKVLE